jgi:hypothetical protein
MIERDNWFSEHVPADVDAQLSLDGPAEPIQPEPETVADVEARARATDPGTSWEAARSLSSERLRASQAAVLDLLRGLGPATDETIAEEYERRGLEPYQSPSGLRTRRSELVRAGRVRDSGQLARLRSGRRSKLWEVPDGDTR